MKLDSLTLLKAKYCPRAMPVQHFVNPVGLCPFYTYPVDSVRRDFVLRDYVWSIIIFGDFAKCNIP